MYFTSRAPKTPFFHPLYPANMSRDKNMEEVEEFNKIVRNIVKTTSGACKIGYNKKNAIPKSMTFIHSFKNK